MILLQIISIDLTRMECKAEEGYIAWMEEFGIDLTRMECKVSTVKISNEFLMV